MSTSKKPVDATTLAKSIAENTASIERYREENALSPLNSETNSVNVIYPPQVEQARQRLLRDSRQLQELVSGPGDLWQVAGMREMICISLIRMVHEFQIPRMVPLDATVSYETLSEKTSIRVGALRQILRAAITFGMFEEPQSGYVAHSTLTKRWAESNGMHDWMEMIGLVIAGATNIVPALRKDPEMGSTSNSSLMVALGTGDPSFYQYLNRNPEKAKLFSRVMSAFQSGDGYDPRHVVNNFDWAALKGGHLVDLGGSMGEIAFALTKNFPDLQITVQDLPSTIQAALEQPDLKGVRFMEHDFFDPQPAHGADVFMFRWILHNWPDALAIRILQALIPALKPGAKVLIVDEIMPAIGTATPEVENNQRVLDLMMLHVFNAKVRELEDWKELFAEADPRFVIVGVQEPQDSRLGLIELQWQG
ncbi:hypothetical protein CERZMDRAFT_34032 [Cercospora zeae-maydis SCOH1-5]|uniref:O-methyltransferase C-terminal domain-containing protein n=1 Tax=Cercospora zeae-maydis SCOH1-5 TaxID=717836 RepID=A0A6A6FT50_9PEZI|nr:hypothetical protein CERZMDRAFT_34032 [Cercospora zeae-maydis SCOH1-5]